uniref:Bcl-2 Bcl-2 homology region 1-3 domain-containing protein n=2 Tax=Branchiostoma floridae TaxID=7739 RepID=C3Y1W4_BRAFL|eukprot:XP_002609844.1 hypothetical protein BRAFLDRAFT_78689 [Branchiostoma floridae]
MTSQSSTDDGEVFEDNGGYTRRRSSSVFLERTHSFRDALRLNFERSRVVSEAKSQGEELMRRYLRQEIERAGFPVPRPAMMSVDSRQSSGAEENAQSQHSEAALLAIDVETLTHQLTYLIKKYVYVCKGEREKLWQKAALETQRENSARNSSEFAEEMRSQLFKNGINVKKIIVLIIFCRDLTIAHLRQGRKGKAADIVSWSVRFIGNWVSDWVAPNGGWAKVLQPPECQTNRLLYTAATVLLLTCAAVGLGVLFQHKRLQ